jgi:hypothetical protein
LNRFPNAGTGWWVDSNESGWIAARQNSALRRFWLPSTLVLTAALGPIVGCSSSQEEELREACSKTEFSACDVLDITCQAMTFRRTQCVREADSAKVPPVNVLTEDELRELFTSGQNDSSDPTLIHSDRVASASFRLLSFLPPDVESAETQDLEFLVANILAFYDPSEDSVTLIDHERAEDRSARDDVLVLAHEFTHAQQDQEIDLIRFGENFGDEGDDSIARHVLPEGDAKLAEFLIQDAREAPATSERWNLTSQARMEGLLSLAVDPNYPYASAARLFPYVIGAHYVASTWFEDGRRGVDRLFLEPSRRSWTYLVKPDAKEPAWRHLDPLDAQDLDKKHWVSDQLGAFSYFSVLGRAIVNGSDLEQDENMSRQALATLDEILERAVAWRGDRIDVFGDEEAGHVVVVWRISVQEELAPSAELLEHLALLTPGQVGSRTALMIDDSTLVLVAAEPGVDLGPWVELARESAFPNRIRRVKLPTHPFDPKIWGSPLHGR